MILCIEHIKIKVGYFPWPFSFWLKLKVAQNTVPVLSFIRLLNQIQYNFQGSREINVFD